MLYPSNMTIHDMYMYILLYFCTFSLEANRGTTVRRADNALGGCTWPEHVASARHANRPSVGRPHAARVAVALPYKGIARGRQLSSRGGSRELPASKALR